MNYDGMRSSASSALQVFIDSTKEKKEQDIINKRELREEENRGNLKAIANSSKESVDVLMEMNLSLKENNMLLREKNQKLEDSMTEIENLLQALFSAECQNGLEQKELMMKANALACEISTTLDRGEKVSWRDKFADGGVQVFAAAIGVILKMKGII